MTHSRVRRGGCWADEGWACRSAFRLRFPPEQRTDHIGFRVVAVGSEKTLPESYGFQSGSRSLPAPCVSLRNW